MTVTEQTAIGASSFKVVMRKRIPYLTNFLLGILAAFACYIFLFQFLFVPVNGTPLDIKVLYFLHVIPSLLTHTLVISVIAIIVITPFYIHLRKYKGALLQILPDHILIRGKSLSENIPASSIRRIYIMDPKTIDGISKEKLTIYIQQKRKRKIRERMFNIRLKDYAEAERLIDSIMQFKNVDFRFYDFHANPDPEQEV